MKNFQFDGEWRFDFYLPRLAHVGAGELLNSPGTNALFKKLTDGYIPVSIVGERNYDPDPSAAQISTIHFLSQQQETIAQALLTIFQNVINPHYAEACGDNTWIPAMRNTDDLTKLIGMREIVILTEQKDNAAYWQINFDYAGDSEHGLAVVFHNEALIDYAGIGDMSYEDVHKDIGMSEEEAFDRLLAAREFGRNMVHKPLPKYKKFKPWQLQATEDFFSELLRKGELQRMKNEIESSGWDVNTRFYEGGKNLVDLAAYYNNVEMITYLVKDRSADFSRSMLECTNYYIKKDAIRCLVDLGASVDALADHPNVTPLYHPLISYLNAYIHARYHQDSNNERYQRALTDLEDSKDKIQFYITMGSNRFRLNEAGDDYKTVIRKQWSEKAIEEYKLFEEIERIMNGV